MAQKIEHPAGLNKWGPLRVSSVLRPDNRVAGPMVVCVLCAAGPNGRGVFYVRPRSVVWSVFQVRLGAPTAGRVIGFGFSCLF